MLFLCNVTHQSLCFIADDAKIHTDDCYGGSCSLCEKGWPITPVSSTPTHSSVHDRIQTVKGLITGHCGHAVDYCCCV